MPPFVRFLQGKPSDTQIRIIRILWAMILILLLAFGWQDFTLAYGLPAEGKYVLGIFPLISLLRGILDPGWFHRKTWRWIMVGSSLIMIILGWFFLIPVASVSDLPNPPVNGTGTTISATEALKVVSPTRAPLNVGFYFSLMGFFLLIAGLLLANKNITQKNEKYGDVIKTIRV